MENKGGSSFAEKPQESFLQYYTRSNHLREENLPWGRFWEYSGRIKDRFKRRLIDKINAMRLYRRINLEFDGLIKGGKIRENDWNEK